MVTGCGGQLGGVVTLALVLLAVLAVGVLAMLAAAVGEIRAARRRSRQLRATLAALPQFTPALLRAAMGGTTMTTDDERPWCRRARAGVPCPDQPYEYRPGRVPTTGECGAALAGRYCAISVPADQDARRRRAMH